MKEYQSVTAMELRNMQDVKCELDKDPVTGLDLSNSHFSKRKTSKFYLGQPLQWAME